MALTEPLEAAVVATSQMLERLTGRSGSPPSQLPASLVRWATGGIRVQLLADGEAEPQHQHDGRRR